MIIRINRGAVPHHDVVIGALDGSRVPERQQGTGQQVFGSPPTCPCSVQTTAVRGGRNATAERPGDQQRVLRFHELGPHSLLTMIWLGRGGRRRH